MYTAQVGGSRTVTRPWEDAVLPRLKRQVVIVLNGAIGFYYFQTNISRQFAA